MGTRGGLLRPRKFEQSSGQVTLNRIEVTISHFPVLNVFGQSKGGGLLHNRKASEVDWSGLPCEARFWDWKLGPAKAHYL